MRFDFVTNADQLDLEITRAERFGLALEPADMVRFPGLPDAENAAIRYLVALPSSGTNDDPGTSNLVPDVGLLAIDKSVQRLFRRELNPRRERLAMIRESSQLKKCEFPRDWALGPGVTFPDMSRLRLGAKWLCAEAVVAGIDGNWDLAVDDIAATLKIGAHAGSDRLLFALQLRIWIETITLRTVEALASMPGCGSAELDRLGRVVASQLRPPPLKEYLRGEAFLTFWYVRNLGKFTDQWDAYRATHPNPYPWCGNDGPFGVERLFVFPPLIERDLVERANAAQCLNYWNQAFEAITVTGVSERNISLFMDDASTAKFSSARPWMPLLSISMPTFGRVSHSPLKLESNRRSILAMLSVLRFKAAEGRWPQGLEEVGSWIDPFDGNKLRFRKTAYGFRIYGVGPNDSNNQGKFKFEMVDEPLPRAEVDQPDDIVACYPASDRLQKKVARDWAVTYAETLQRYNDAKMKPKIRPRTGADLNEW